LLQAAIAALHDEATSAGATDWRQIALLYGELTRLRPDPVVELNRAVAVAMAEGAPIGLALLDRLAAVAELQGNHLYHAARGDFLARLGRSSDAVVAYQRALELTGTAVERRFLEQRLTSLSSPERD